MAEINTPTGLIRNFQTQLEHQWQRYRGTEGDDSARGSSYESALQDLLDEYFGGRFDIWSNCSVMDSQLACFDTFEKNAQNEIDVVALFSQASPRIVLREMDMNWVPLEGISFLCEVKSRVDKGRLESDLRKLEILRELEIDPDDRFPTKVHGDYTVDHQLHCLIYDKGTISDDTLNSLLDGSDAWDLVLLVEDDTLIVNGTLPILPHLRSMAVSSQVMNADDEENDGDRVMEAQLPANVDCSCISLSNGLAWFILAISVTIPVPLGVGTSSCLFRLLQQSITGLQWGAKSEVTKEDTVEWKSVDPEDIE